MNLKFLPIFQETEKNSDLHSEEIHENGRRSIRDVCKINT